MTQGFQLNEAVLHQVVRGPEGQRYFGTVGRQVRDRARAGASSITDKTDAIVFELGQDARSLFVDVGYDKHHPGFFLWWWEVGTRNHRAVPHLRPALSPRPS